VRARPSRSPADPIEPANRGVYKFNDALDRGILKPTAKGYDKVTPGWLKTGIGNFFTNLSYPFTIVNQLLQGKPRQAGQDTARFLINTTLGFRRRPLTSRRALTCPITTRTLVKRWASGGSRRDPT
jgi:ABC-type transporter lipoprotein component MlaA